MHYVHASTLNVSTLHSNPEEKKTKPLFPCFQPIELYFGGSLPIHASSHKLMLLNYASEEINKHDRFFVGQKRSLLFEILSMLPETEQL